MRMIKLGAVVLGTSLLAGCDGAPATQGGPPAERIRAIASEVAATTIGYASVSGESVSLQFISSFDGAPSFASTNELGQVSVKEYPAINEVAFLTRPVAIDALRLEAFASRLDTLTACPEPEGTIYATHGGAILQEIACPSGDPEIPPVIHETYLDDQRVEPLLTWDEATLTLALQEARKLIGDKAVVLNFYASAMIGASYQAMSEPMAGPYLGWSCNVIAQRFGIAQEQTRPVQHMGCMAMIAPEVPTSFSLSDVKPASVMTAITSGAAELGIPVEQVQHFEIVWEDPARLQLQVSTDLGEDEPRRVVIPLD